MSCFARREARGCKNYPDMGSFWPLMSSAGEQPGSTLQDLIPNKTMGVILQPSLGRLREP